MQAQLHALQEKYVAALEEARATQTRLADDKAKHETAIDAIVDETQKTVRGAAPLRSVTGSRSGGCTSGRWS